jgi:Fe2+ transport system protein FeoA
VARISEVAEHEAPQLLATLDRHGLLPGVELRVVDRQAAGQTVRVGATTAELDEGVARAIWVEGAP